MEIASPLALQSYVRCAKKRGYSCSPTFVDSHGPSSLLTATKEESMSEYTTNLPMESEYLNTHQPGFKRRRFNTNEVTGSPSFLPVFSNVAGQPQASSLAHSGE